MSSGRICPRCLRDIVIVCQCRVVSVKSNSKPASTTSHVIPAPPKPLIATPLPSTTNGQNGSSIIGTSTLLEKSYSRPSAAPTMSLVRPVHVLKEAFGRCIQRPKTDLAYISDQLKSIRQDLTVQASSADSAFKAMVYEYHARVSLLVGNAPEFGQCLNNVHALHAKGYFGTDCHEISPSTSIPAINPPTTRSPRSTTGESPSPVAVAYSSLVEFAAYRIVYTGLMSKYEDDLAMVMTRLETRQKHHPPKRQREETEAAATTHVEPHVFRWNHPLVEFAVGAVNNRHNASLYLALAARSPSAAFRALLLLFVPRIRIDWLKSLVGGFSGVLSAEKLREWLGLGTVDAVVELLAPIAGDAWSNTHGLVVHRARDRLMKYLAEITEQRSMS